MSRAFPLSLVLAVLVASTGFAQENLRIKCEVYRLDKAARAKVAASKTPLDAKQVRALGARRFHASLVVRLGTSVQVERSRRIPFRTVTSNQGVTQENIQFLDLNDSLACTTAAKGNTQTLSVSLSLSDAEAKDSSGLPVQTLSRLNTQVGLTLGTDVLLFQGSARKTSDSFQVTILRVERVGSK